MLTLLACTARAMRSLPCYSLHEVEGLRLAECLQGHLANRQVTPQVGQLDGKLRVELQLIAAYRTQQQYAAVMPLPVASQVAHQVQRGPIHPVQVIQQ